ncbi:MAG: tetratricopeptide repeat protein [Saprospiraceae bacterium]|nr:tetratricopeptide repeat protein [Saprospiraceae bacterium]
MEILNGIFIALGSIALVLFTRSITTLVHELGHAIPSLLFTSGPVHIFVGSYGDVESSFHFKLGRLDGFLKFNVFAWYLGLCRSQGAESFWAGFLIILGGPLMSLLLGLSLLYIMVFYQPGVFGMFSFCLLLLSSLWDFFVNIIPRSEPISLENGGTIFNDGYQLRELWTLGARHQSFVEALELSGVGEADTSIELLQQMNQQNPLPKQTRLELIRLLIREKRIQEAADHFNDIFQNKKKIKIKDYDLYGDIHYGLNQIREAIDAWNKYLNIYYQDWNVLNKRIRAMLDLGYLDAAEREIEASIQLNSVTNMEGFMNRIRLGLQKGSLVQVQEDLFRVLQLKADSPQVHLFYGFYYEKIGNYVDAEIHYRQARALGTDYHGIELKVEEMKRQNSL